MSFWEIFDFKSDTASKLCPNGCDSFITFFLKFLSFCLQGMHPKMQVNFTSAPRQGEIIFCLGEVCRLKIYVNENFSWPSTSFTELWKLARNSFKVNHYFWYAPQNVGLPFSNFLLNKFITSNMLPHVRCWINWWYFHNRLIKLY